MDFDAAVAYISGRLQFGIKLGNERFSTLMARLGNPQREYRIAHIAGTKGKGSTTAMIASILHEHGFRVGGYYSPYVFDLCERVQVDGQNIPRDDFARQVTEVAPHVEALAATELGETTEFELKTAVAFRYFAERKVDFATVEVGLGGRLDATNIVDPQVTVITNIGLDHTHILGNTHAKIAYEKAGIIKPGIPVITATDHPEAFAVIREVAANRSAPITRVGTSHGCNGICFSVQDGLLRITTPRADYQHLCLGLLGNHQFANAACAIGAVEVMADRNGFLIDQNATRRGLEKVYLPGRFEIVRRNPMVIIDAAHNELASTALAAELLKIGHQRMFLVVGMTAGHSPNEFLRPLAPLTHKLYATQPTWYKALPPEDIAIAAKEHGIAVDICEQPADAARAALSDASPEDLVLITGSFYVLGDLNLQSILQESPVSCTRL